MLLDGLFLFMIFAYFACLGKTEVSERNNVFGVRGGFSMVFASTPIKISARFSWPAVLFSGQSFVSSLVVQLALQPLATELQASHSPFVYPFLFFRRSQSYSQGSRGSGVLMSRSRSRTPIRHRPQDHSRSPHSKSRRSWSRFPPRMRVVTSSSQCSVTRFSTATVALACHQPLCAS